MGALRGLKVIRSPIHGYGVVASRPFQKGEIIAKVDGVLMHEDEDFDDTYALAFGDGWLWDMVDQTRWINHSCDPNGMIEGEREGKRAPWMHIRAIRDIRAGEEISYDYSFPKSLAEPCACGSRKCRGLYYRSRRFAQAS